MWILGLTSGPVEDWSSISQALLLGSVWGDDTRCLVSSPEGSAFCSSWILESINVWPTRNRPARRA